MKSRMFRLPNVPRQARGYGVDCTRLFGIHCRSATSAAGAITHTNISTLSISREVRSIPERPLASTTVNFVGRRNYSAEEVPKRR